MRRLRFSDTSSGGDLLSPDPFSVTTIEMNRKNHLNFIAKFLGFLMILFTVFYDHSDVKCFNPFPVHNFGN